VTSCGAVKMGDRVCYRGRRFIVRGFTWDRRNSRRDPRIPRIPTRGNAEARPLAVANARDAAPLVFAPVQRDTSEVTPSVPPDRWGADLWLDSPPVKDSP